MVIVGVICNLVYKTFVQFHFIKFYLLMFYIYIFVFIFKKINQFLQLLALQLLSSLRKIRTKYIELEQESRVTTIDMKYVTKLG